MPFLEKDIVLVGNGRSLLQRRGLGTRIDTFPIVVRFNNFSTAGFEAFVGQKTDWWARAENEDILPRAERLQRIVLRLQGEDSAAFQKGMQELVPTLRLQYPETPLEVIPRVVFTTLIEDYGFSHAPLTGTLVVAHLLHQFSRVHVCGFDNLAGTPETLRHYYSDENVIDDWTTYHEPDKEAAYLHRQVKEGRVIRLDAL